MNPTKILDHCMIVKVMQRDRILDPNEPQNFLIESASVAKILDTYVRLFPDSESAIEHITRDIGDSVEIRKKGGTGQGLALFLFVGRVWEGGKHRVILWLFGDTL